MKKQASILAGTLGIITILITTAFTFKNNGEPVITIYCGTPEKSSNGITGRTQSPHDLGLKPLSCEECHGGGSATPVISLTASPAFGTGNTYIPGTTYTISYKVTGYSKFGFDLEIDNGNLTTSTAIGTLTAVTNSRIASSEILHSTPISSSSSATFTWKAPSTGTAYLYSTGLGVNGTGNTGGDKQAFYNLVLNPAPNIAMTCPGNQTINSSTSTVVPDLTSNTTASSSCLSGSITKTQSPVAGTPLSLGNNVITVTATDGCSNTNTCTSTINYVFNTGVINMTCPANQTINSSTSTVVPNLISSTTASTNCPGGVVTKTQSPTAGTPLSLGNNIITVTATDACGDSKTCTSIVNYVFNTGVISLTCPINQTINSSSSSVVPNLVASTQASTNCPSGIVTITQSPVSGTPLTLGNNIITITATDICGDQQQCTSTINYVFNTGVISTTCPGDQTINSSISTVVPDLSSSLIATTNCPNPSVNISQFPTAGTSLISGNNIVTITATDICGTTKTCVSTISHVINTGALILTCAGNQNIPSSTSTLVPDLTLLSNVVTSCVGNVIKTQTPLPGTPLSSGVNTITITASDNCNHTQTCTASINHLINTGVISLSCPQTQTINESVQTTVPNLTTLINATTSCPLTGSITKTQFPIAGSQLSPGNNIIVITATDACNDIQTCNVIVNYVNDLGLNSLETSTRLEMYPNPTTDNLTINYTLNSESSVQGEILDLNGKIISIIISEKSNLGHYSKNINLESIESGIYFINLRINGEEIYKKLIIE